MRKPENASTLRLKTIFLVVVLLLLGSSCGQPSDDTPRLILIYATCSLNKNYISPYNSAVDYTPNLGAFAARARVFERHHTEAGESGIAFASLYTGGDARVHGVYYHPGWIPDEIEMLSEVLREGGYDTFFWDKHEMASKRFNYAQGVDDSHVLDEMLTDRSKTFDEILDRISRDPDYKVAILHNNAVPHWPYAHPSAVKAFGRRFPDETADVDWTRVDQAYRLFEDEMLSLQYNFDETVQRLGLSDDDLAQLTAFLEASYKTQVESLDKLFGSIQDRILETGLLDDSLTVFTSDHGELLFRDNAPFKWTHSFQLSNEVMNVPLIIGSGRPRIPAGRYQGVTRSIDVLPTVAGLLGLDGSVSGDGVDLSKALRGSADEPDLIARFHTAFSPEDWSKEEIAQWADITLANTLFPGYSPDTIWVGLRSGDLLFKHRTLRGGGWVTQAFDLAVDPGETNDIFDPASPGHLAKARRLKAYKASLEAGFLEHEAMRQLELPIDEQERLEALKSLGYVR